jgi:aerobic carbon-monoxide dehydrogenase small subunit
MFRRVNVRLPEPVGVGWNPRSAASSCTALWTSAVRPIIYDCRVTVTSSLASVRLIVNGAPYEVLVEPRRSLLDCLREDLHLHGTHAGCEHGVCGCCNVLLDGDLVRSCLVLAAQVDGAEVTTVEGLESPAGLSPLQEAFCEFHGLQCGYCTPGMLITLTDLLASNPTPTDAELVEAISGNLCRCTGYQQILQAARAVIAQQPA